LANKLVQGDRADFCHIVTDEHLCGIAKDLTKLGGKTDTKIVTPDTKETHLFKLVSFITGEFRPLASTSMLCASDTEISTTTTLMIA
jgi:hypothetical protein